jgi:3-methyladenine DNA glycosylase/8-oxoguanine DNA glycosylase
MEDSKLYYTAPTATAFAEMKQECLEQWATHDNTYGYVDEKTKRIKDIANTQDNFMYMLAMFDQGGQRSVISRLSPETKEAVRERMISGGNDEYILRNLGL